MIVLRVHVRDLFLMLISFYIRIFTIEQDMDKDTYTLVRDPTDLNAGISSEDTTTTLVSDEIKK